MTIHKGLTITATDHLIALLEDGDVFRACTFDGARSPFQQRYGAKREAKEPRQ